MSKAIEPKDWEKFLGEFSTRNQNRRGRFYIFFASGETLEEEEEGRFKGASLSRDADKTRVVVERGTTEGDQMTDPIENVRGVAVRYEDDGSENILEITDGKNTLFSLRFESKLDGDS